MGKLPQIHHRIIWFYMSLRCICCSLPIFARLTRSWKKSRSWTIWCWKWMNSDSPSSIFPSSWFTLPENAPKEPSCENLVRFSWKHLTFLNCGCYSSNYLVLNCRAFFNNGRLFRKFGLFAFSYFDGEKELGLSSFRRITLFLDLIQEKLETRK